MKALLVLCLIALASCQNSGPTTGRGYGAPASYSVVPLATEYRLINGSGNNVNSPLLGVTGTAVVRVANNPNGFADLISIPRGGLVNNTLPNARFITNTVFAYSPGLTGGQFNPQNANGFTVFSTHFGQFEDHDYSLGADIAPRGTAEFNVLIPRGDIFLDPTSLGNQTITVERFQFDNTTGTSPQNPRAVLNFITGTIDLNNVYGSDDFRAFALRLKANGLLNTTGPAPGYLPFNDQIDPSTGMPFANAMPGAFRSFAGDVRPDENVALNSLHILFVREHNSIARQIAASGIASTDINIFQEARRRNIAQLQNILFAEWLPLYMGNLFPTYAYDPTRPIQASVEGTHFAFRFGHTMLVNILFRRDANNVTVGAGDILLQNSFFVDPQINVINIGADAYYLGLTQQTQNEIDSFIVDAVRNFLFDEGGNGGLDLIAINIQRGRETGIPTFNILRQQYGLATIASFALLTPDSDIQNRLNLAYPNGIVDCDPWTCALAETHVTGNGINANTGALLRAVIMGNFNDRRVGDRLWFENNQFTATDLQNTIYPTVIADLIVRNSGVTAIQCHAFTSRDGCTIGTGTIASQRPTTSTANVNLVFNLLPKTAAHTQAAIGSRFGYTVSSASSALTPGGEGATITLIVNTQYTFASDASCASRLFISSTIVGGTDSAATPAINGQESCIGRIFTWTPTATGTYYYGSRYQLNAGGTINVVTTPTRSFSGMLAVNVAAIVAAILAFFF